MFKKNREIKECLRSFSASQSCLSWWKASLMWWVIKMMSNKSVVHWFRGTCLSCYQTPPARASWWSLDIRGGWHCQKEGLTFFFPSLRLRKSYPRYFVWPFKWKLVKRCWSCWTRRTTTGSTQKEFLYRREHSLNGRCWIIQVLNYSQKYLGAELFSELFRCWIILRNILKPVWSRFNASPYGCILSENHSTLLN